MLSRAFHLLRPLASENVMRLIYLGLAMIMVTLAAAPARAKLAPLDPAVQEKQLAQAEEFYAKQDVNGLLKLLRESHLFIKNDVALKLGRLGAREALADLREYDRRYSRFACAPSGEFGVAIILIENKSPDRQREALLAAATETGNNAKHTHSVIDAAGKELSRFDGDDIITALADVNTYGAQYTVLTLQCKRLSEADAIAKCIAVLEAHETPQKAEAAQRILAGFGKSAELAVKELKARMEKRIKPEDATFTISRTIVSRCNRILEQIKNE
jgi:septum formation inhibitor MinC